MPGTAVTAPPWAAEQPRPLPQSFASGAFDHTSLPVSMFTARIPPGVWENVALTPKYAFLPSTAPPHCPPSPLPPLVRYSQIFAPFLSGSKPYAIPDFDWMIRMSWPFDFFASIGDAEKSWSGPCSAGQRGLSGFFAWQPIIQTSLGTGCATHLIVPLSRSIAITASVVGCCGSEYPLPVATYRTPRRGSIVGAAQMPPPDGPQACTPSFVTPRFFGSSLIVYVFQMTLPLLASSA